MVSHSTKKAAKTLLAAALVAAHMNPAMITKADEEVVPAIQSVAQPTAPLDASDFRSAFYAF